MTKAWLWLEEYTELAMAVVGWGQRSHAMLCSELMLDECIPWTHLFMAPDNYSYQKLEGAMVKAMRSQLGTDEILLDLRLSNRTRYVLREVDSVTSSAFMAELVRRRAIAGGFANANKLVSLLAKDVEWKTFKGPLRQWVRMQVVQWTMGPKPQWACTQQSSKRPHNWEVEWSNEMENSHSLACAALNANPTKTSLIPTVLLLAFLSLVCTQGKGNKWCRLGCMALHRAWHGFLGHDPMLCGVYTENVIEAMGDSGTKHILVDAAVTGDRTENIQESIVYWQQLREDPPCTDTPHYPGNGQRRAIEDRENQKEEDQREAKGGR